MAGKCLQFKELLQGWTAQRQEVKRHVLDCERCRQILLVSGSLRSLRSYQKPPSAGFHLWRKRIHDHGQRVARATLPISAMYFVVTVVALTLLLIASDPNLVSPLATLLRDTGLWALENELVLWIGGTLALAFLLTGILRLEEE